MKTIAVLLVLVGLAIAAPAPQDGFQGLENSEGFHPIDFNTEINGQMTARSFKSPVIVKRKTGYHLYRDSTEERADADPRESCGKQVRVKLCDDASAKAADLKRSTMNKNIHADKDEVEESIKMAKEAVEHLQRDMKNNKQDTSGKSALEVHEKADKELHEDIEAARLALEHAESNFGTLDSMQMRAASPNDKTLQDIEKAKLHQERMAQWKEAMENIQKNVEIAKNIENSFKAAEHHESFLNSEAMDTTKFMRSENHENKEVFHNIVKETTSSSTSGRRASEEKTEKKMTGIKSEHHMNIETNAHHFADDMRSAASEKVQLKHASASDAPGNLAHVSLNAKPLGLKADIKLLRESGTELDTSLRRANNDDKMSAQNMETANKMLQSNIAHKVTLNKELSSRTSENTQHQFAAHKDESSSSMKKTIESHNVDGSVHQSMQQGKSVAREWESNIADKNSKHQKSAWSQTEHKDMIMKSSEHNLEDNMKAHLEQDKKHIVTDSLDAKTLMKSAEHSTEHKHHKEDAQEFVKKGEASLHGSMKAADNVELASDINLNVPISILSNPGANLNIDKKQGKSVEMEKARGYGGGHIGIGHHEHGHHLHGHHDIGHLGHHGHHEHGHFEHGHGIHLGHHGHHGHGHHHGYHGKSVDLDSALSPSMQVEIAEFEKSAMESQWKHHHDAARSSYGLGGYGGGLNLAAGGSGGAGAVGVFPHAKIGGCGVPLLLSCAPSVVSGSLAKPHAYAASAPASYAASAPASYAAPAPAYRNPEESNKNKRDILKVKETSKNKDAPKFDKTKDLEKKL